MGGVVGGGMGKGSSPSIISVYFFHTIYGYVGVCIWTDRQTDGWMDGEMMEIHTDRWTDEQMDGQNDRQTDL